MKKKFESRDPPMGGLQLLFSGGKTLCDQESTKRNIHEKCNLCR